MAKTIHYRQVEWFGDQNRNLPKLLATTLHTRPNVDDTKFRYDGEVWEVRHRSVSEKEIRLHFAAYVPGAKKAISRLVQRRPSADLGETAPPNNSEFTEREVAIVVRRNALGYVTSGMNTYAKKVQGALRNLMRIHHDPEICNSLFLVARADREMTAKLLREGVDKLELNLAIPYADGRILVEDQPLSLSEGLGKAVSHAINTRITYDRDDREIDSLGEMSARLRLSLRKRKPSLEQIDTLTDIARCAVEDDDEGFRIRTLDKREFTHDKLIIKSSFEGQNNLAYLNYSMAWDAISNFLNGV